jgi:sulfur-oxidizing protein SoxZ
MNKGCAMANLPTRIVLPATAKKGEIIEIKTLVQHPMEPGYRRDNEGRAIPRDIIATLTVQYAGVEIFKCDMQPGTAANPYVAFTTTATETGELTFTWVDEKGTITKEARKITVV